MGAGACGRGLKPRVSGSTRTSLGGHPSQPGANSLPLLLGSLHLWAGGGGGCMSGIRQCFVNSSQEKDKKETHCCLSMPSSPVQVSSFFF